MSIATSRIALAALLIGVAALTGCQKAEIAGKQIDKAAVEAGKELKQAAQEAGKAMENAGAKMQEKAKEAQANSSKDTPAETSK
jgi:vacuolar-type H+-ATPase subunit H